MEENFVNDVKENKEKRNTFFYIIIVEIITVAIIFASLICMKYFFKNEYKKFYNWYEKSFLCETNINEVIGEMKNEV